MILWFLILIYERDKSKVISQKHNGPQGRVLSLRYLRWKSNMKISTCTHPQNFDKTYMVTSMWLLAELTSPLWAATGHFCKIHCLFPQILSRFCVDLRRWPFLGPLSGTYSLFSPTLRRKQTSSLLWTLKKTLPTAQRTEAIESSNFVEFIKPINENQNIGSYGPIW